MFIWIVIGGGLFAFICSMGIGANDAANAFATSVGSKSLTMRQAAIIAAIFETSGAILMGSHVTDTIRKGIADYKCFEDTPELLMYGCFWVIISVSIWLFLASYLEMPVSTTHSCVGGMIGMTIALAGSDCVIWYKETDDFPFVGGVLGIVISWFVSPILSAFSSAFIFAVIRKLVLRHPYATNRIYYVYPVLVGGTLIINTFFIIYKGAKGLDLDDTNINTAIFISLGVGGSGVIITSPVLPYLKKKIDKQYSTRTISNNETTISNNETTISNNETTISNNETTISNIDNIVNSRKELNINSDSQLKTIKNIHESAEKFEPQTEEFFKYLQVFTAMCDAFSHGANDVANSIGPFAAIYLIYRENGDITKKLDMKSDSYWILSIGGFGIAVGLILYGKKIIHAIGTKLCKITPSRGSCIELGSAIVIITGSRMKIPLSTTHCQIGATVGVGILENKSLFSKIEGINKWILLKTAFGWVITCVIVGITSGILAAQGAYAPTVENGVRCSNNSIEYTIN